jgi:hypothetical protein
MIDRDDRKILLVTGLGAFMMIGLSLALGTQGDETNNAPEREIVASAPASPSTAPTAPVIKASLAGAKD